MSVPTDITKVAVLVGTGVQLMDRIEGVDGSNITQSDVSTVARQVFDLESADPTAETAASIAADDRVVATVIFDTLQTDDRWDEDTTGYNFRDQIEAAIVTDAHMFLVVYTFTPVSGEVFKRKYIVHGE